MDMTSDLGQILGVSIENKICVPLLVAKAKYVSSKAKK